MTKLYRVILKSTCSLQPGSGGTYWKREVLYVGADIDQARIAYHKSEPYDECRGYGNSCSETLWQVLDDEDEDEPGEFVAEVA